MTNTLSDQLITHQDNLAKYIPPEHDGTVNIRLLDRSFCENFELVLGEVEPGGLAYKHHHETEHQAIYVLSGLAQITLIDEDPVECGPGAIVKLPPKVDHHVLSIGSEPLKVVIVYSPPLAKRGDVPVD